MRRSTAVGIKIYVLSLGQSDTGKSQRTVGCGSHFDVWRPCLTAFISSREFIIMRKMSQTGGGVFALTIKQGVFKQGLQCSFH